MQTILDTVEQHIRERVNETGRVLMLTSRGDGHGLVMWSRKAMMPALHGDTEYVVHRWATTYTDGQPVKDGVMLYSGGYYTSRKEAEQDYEERA